MSIIVKSVQKRYGTQLALDDVNFEIKTGEILGFLGPNGAGKSTMMKIITTYLPQTTGSVTVCGFDTATDPLEVRKRVGYLPESNPLYFEMYVREYLEFVAGLTGASKNAVGEMISKTGLTPEAHKKIGQLSKGYKQRVGLAQALLHNPDVLILDEPTSGLDPNQLVEIRSLIREIGKEKTVMFSTHIMQEVEALCDRVIIIKKGKIVADKTIDELRQMGSQVQVKVVFDGPVPKAAVRAIPGVQSVKDFKSNGFLITSAQGKEVHKVLFELANKHGVGIEEIHQETLRLEDVFQELTKN
jgi:ABC-2 type transport system ATP-binding protein